MICSRDVEIKGTLLVVREPASNSAISIDVPARYP